MRGVTRRQALIGIAALGAAALGTRTSLAEPAEGRVIEIEARRFKFAPKEITVKRGEAVTLAFRSIDFVHGFSLPDFKLRADLLPSQITKVRLQPLRAGRFTFLCDNFCGEGHEDMNGVLIVEG